MRNVTTSSTVGWDEGKFVSEEFVNLHVNANVLHYGQAVFEGLKAFQCKDGKVRACCDKKNHDRLTRGCHRLMMPEISYEKFQKGIDWAVRENADFVPPYGVSGCALYIRPVMFGSGKQLALGPSDEFKFLVIVMPVSSYYSGGLKGVKAMLVENYDRAAPKGVGAVKVAGNYASDFKSQIEGQEAGYPVGLYLDPRERRYIEEFNTSNFVAISGNKYLTPDSESVLGSITNLCLQQLASDCGLTVERRRLDFKKEIESFDEVGAVGTAVIMTPIVLLHTSERDFEFKGFSMLQKLMEKYREIQNGEAEDIHGWMRAIEIE